MLVPEKGIQKENRMRILECSYFCAYAAARYGTPEEVAGLVRFLATDPASAYITGQVGTLTIA